MKFAKIFTTMLLALTLAMFFPLVGCSPAQVPVPMASVGVGVSGVPMEPSCMYEYYDYAPYGCAPMGYYDNSYFSGGMFIGIGPWYHHSYNRYYRYNSMRGYHSHTTIVVHNHYGYGGSRGYSSR